MNNNDGIKKLNDIVGTSHGGKRHYRIIYRIIVNLPMLLAMRMQCLFSSSGNIDEYLNFYCRIKI